MNDRAARLEDVDAAFGESAGEVLEEPRAVPADAGVHHYEYVFPDGAMYVYDMDAAQRLVQRVGLPMARGIRGEFLVAIAQQSDEIFLVLDVNSLLTSDEQRELRTASLS